MKEFLKNLWLFIKIFLVILFTILLPIVGICVLSLCAYGLILLFGYGLGIGIFMFLMIILIISFELYKIAKDR